MACTYCPADAVIRRGAAEELRGRASFDDAGVTVRSDTGARIFVPWDRVRTVYADQPVPGLEAKLEIAEDLWRARSRLERGDATLAEPIFGEMFARFRGQTHETALVAAEGLLRCTLARGAQAEAVLPALESIRLRRAGIETASYTMLPPVIDDQSELCRQLPPFWIADRNLLSLDDALDRFDAKGDRVVEALASLFHRSIRAHLGGPAPERAPLPETNHLGLQLLEQCIRSSVGEGEDRVAAQDALSARMDELPHWAQAWARMAIGAGLLTESNQAMRDLGLVHLAYVPARFGGNQPFLAGLALERIKSAMEARGDHDAATAIDIEIRRRFPGHPILLNSGGTSAATRSS